MHYKIPKVYTVEIAEDRYVTADVIVYVVQDRSYGADIDGNRGVEKLDIDDWDFDLLPSKDDDGKPLAKEELIQLHNLVDKEIFSEDATDLVYGV
jgi:hypothetical protein